MLQIKALEKKKVSSWNIVEVPRVCNELFTEQLTKDDRATD